MMGHSRANMPAMTQIDFTGKYRQVMMNNLPRGNMPHLKRIINQQVFLEESEPYIYEDGRRNSHAIDAASLMMSPNHGLPPMSAQYMTQQDGMLPSLGPGTGPQDSSLFYVPKYGHPPALNPGNQIQHYQSLAPQSAVQNP